ncbi:MAG: CPBP family intramembrane metalloprotease, partial [Spirochaetia bacterium]|nr:CPBP family intramembrane metalloprotease [Spirochaetia bacterium]
VIFFIRRKRGQQIREYLVLNSVSPLKFVLWQIAMIVIYYFTNYITEKMSVPQPDFMNVMRNIAASESVFNLALLAAALVLTAPLFEEIMFRGFMFTGLASSRAGVVGAAMIPALLWSLVHFQYEWIWVAIIFFMGLAFALARYTTGSIYTVFFMHAINNFLSFLEVIKTNTQ